MRGKEIAKIAIQEGWTEVRSKGSHHTFKHPNRPDHIVIPFAHAGRELDAGLSRQIMHQLRRGNLRVAC